VGSSSEITLGIDLGTTFSTAAAVVDGKLHFAVDGRGEPCVPSVVHFPKSGPPLVGADADRARATDPHHTVFGIKRLLGRAADSPQGRLLDACSAFKIVPQGAGEAAVQVRSGTYTASEVAALLLRYLRERAETRFGKPIRRAVLTAPVGADDRVREAMVRCGRMAGLEVLRIVHEPCAGALARGVGIASSRPVLVYDFGGGTFDASVVQRAGAALRVLSASGDDCLGGDDFSLAFARFVEAGVYRVHKVEASRDVLLWDQVQRQCEMVKRALSAAEEARFRIADAFSGGGRPRGLEFTFRRDHLAPSWTPLVERSLSAAADGVAQAGIDVQDLGGVLLIGGTTFVPLVRSGVARAFPVPCVAEDDPQTAVARGAALLAAHPEILTA
jgi:molecular chaperone DnaK (HSP70)